MKCRALTCHFRSPPCCASARSFVSPTSLMPIGNWFGAMNLTEPQSIRIASIRIAQALLHAEFRLPALLLLRFRRLLESVVQRQILGGQRRTEVPVALVAASQPARKFRRFAPQGFGGRPRNRCTSPASPSARYRRHTRLLWR